jgi:hypothetical protein
MDFDAIWQRVQQHAGEEFYELGGKRFTYSADADSLQPSAHEQAIPRHQFQRALESGLLGNLRELKRQFGQREHSYIFSILTDARITKV